jgi:4-amino-4-deoxychorismate lyase
MYLYLNGKFVSKEEAVISPFDHGYLYGLGVFETFRTYDGHPFLLEDHLKRLDEGLKELNINASITVEFVLDILNQLLQKNKMDNAYCRLNISAGAAELGLQTEVYGKPTVILLQKPLPPSPPLQEKAAVLLEIRRNTPETDKRLKSHHYLNNIAAKREIGAGNNQEGIFLSQNGFISEGITSNIFWATNGELYTPSIDTGILNGITRQYIIQLAKTRHIPVHTGFYTKEEMMNADEIFFTNSVQEIIPVTAFESVSFPGRKGKIVNLLHADYQQYVDHLWSNKQISKEGMKSE